MTAQDESRPEALRALDREIVDCRACPRLVEWREQVAREKRASFREDDYWGRPVTGFGDPRARVLIAGLAPAAHGANRTGRVFTGDRSGDFLYASLFRTGFANQPTATSTDDGLALHGAYISAAVRCAPPANKPTPAERDRCQPFLERELALLGSVRVVVVLGAFAYEAMGRVLARSGAPLPVPRPKFGHGMEVATARAVVLGCYHPSQQNTFTGRLTPVMLDAVFTRARDLAGAVPLAPVTAGRLLEGVYVPLITPYAADGSVALDAVERLSHEYLDAGSAGIVALGTTGESSALDAGEQRAVIDTCGRVCAAHDAQLIVGAGTNSTAKTVAAVEALAGTPALVAALIVVPYYVRPSEAGVIAHFEAVAAASPVPVVVYNIPVRTGRNLGPAGMLELARNPGIVGVKQAVGALDTDTLEILADAPWEFSLLGGDDPFLFPTVLMGGAGAICASAHVCTERFVAMTECALTGKVDDGRAHAEALLPVVQSCFAEPNPSVFKGVLHAEGRIPTPDVRLPLVAASAGAVDHAMAAVQAAQ